MMKDILFGAMFGLLLSASILTAQTCRTMTSSPTTFSRDDSGFTPPGCNMLGTGCIVSVLGTWDYDATVNPVPGGYVLLVNETVVIGTVSRGGLVQSYPLGDRTIMFTTGSTVTIHDCPTYPFLVGEVIDISGVSTNVNGGFSIQFIP